MADTIFGSEVPSVTDASDGTTYTLGTLWYSDAAGTITHGRWRCPDVAPAGTVYWVLWDYATGTELRRQNMGTLTAGAWNEVALSSTYTYSTPGTYLVASVVTPDRYVATLSRFASSGITSGHLTAPQDQPADHNGRIFVGDGYPSSGAYLSSSYYADLVFQAAGASSISVSDSGAVAETVVAAAAVPVGGDGGTGADTVGIGVSAPAVETATVTDSVTVTVLGTMVSVSETVSVSDAVSVQAVVGVVDVAVAADAVTVWWPGMTAPDSVCFRPLRLPWRLGLRGCGVGSSVSVRADSVEYVEVGVEAWTGGVWTDPTSGTFEFGVSASVDVPPVTWVSGSWVTDVSAVPDAYAGRVLVGSGSLDLVAGTYVAWARVGFSPESVVRTVGTLTVV